MWYNVFLSVAILILCRATSGFVVDSFKNLGPTCIRCDNTSSWTPCSEVLCDLDEECYVYVTEPNIDHLHIDQYSINAGCIKRAFCNSHHDHNSDIKVVCDDCCSGDNCILEKCAHKVHLEHPFNSGVPTCNVCNKRHGEWICDSTQSCSHHQVCYVQESIYYGEIHYQSGCIKQKDCGIVTLGQVNNVGLFGRALGDRVPLVTAGRCCDTSRCNTISSLRPPPTTTITTTTTTSTPSTTPTTTTTTTTADPARQCEVCSGQCDGNLTSCPADSTLCMTGVVNHQDGQQTYTKSCATINECDEKWLKDTTIKPECIGFHPDSTYTFNFNCTFCCTTDGCNRDPIPSVDSLYLKT